ncbi:MAG: glycosyltransferase family 39 protein [Candidatus Omnitrophica bacterium]|nr:glycosyltransferase family 39 protein [Candidatus Omnitrophota bacterium]MCK5287428.1 glycosyltransferase family 39 protein [Candidatus Omnitrophota bacterium]MCK5393265.1 glycosyltransferase family 39 protein [Candidatus Omnitrophota bacterium]
MEEDKSKKNLVLIFFIGVILRLYKLGEHNLWHDEAFMVFLCQYPFKVVSNIILQGPLHMLMVKYFIHMTNANEFFLRLPAMFFGCISIPLLYFFVKLLFNKKIAIIASFLLAVSPFHIWYSQELARYSQAMFFGLWANYLFVRFLKDDKRWIWLLLIIVQTLSFYTSYILFLALAPQLIIVLMPAYRKKIKIWMLSTVIALFLFCPLAKIFYTHFNSVNDKFWIPNISFFDIYILFCNFNLGYTVSPNVFLICIVLLLGLIVSGLKSSIINYKRAILIVGIFFIIPLGALLIISLSTPIFISRIAIPFYPYYLVFLSLGIESYRRINLQKGIIFFLILLNTFSLVNYFNYKIPSEKEYHIGVFERIPIQPVVDYLKNRVQDDDIIAFSNSSYDFPFYYYWGEGYKSFYFIFPEVQDIYYRGIFYKNKKVRKSYRTDLLSLSNYKKDPVFYDNYGYRGSYYIDLTGKRFLKFNRIWLVSGGWEKNYKLDHNSQAVIDWMRANYLLVSEKWINGVLVGHYSKPEIK